MKLKLSCLVILFLVSIALAQEYRCTTNTVCDTDRLKGIADKARDDLTDAVNIRLGELIERLDITQARIRTAINSETFRNGLIDELDGKVTDFREGSSKFVDNLIEYLTSETVSIREAITEYTRSISFSYFEMIFQKLSDRFERIITAIREAKECVLNNLNDRGFMNTTNAVNDVISSSRDTIDRIASLTRIALSDLSPVKERISGIVEDFKPIPSCLQVFSTSLGCRLCEFPDNQITVSERPCFDFCDQTTKYCLSVIRGALPNVRDAVRIIKLISEALEKGTIQERYRDTLVSFSSLADAIENLGENVLRFLKDFDIVDFIGDVANECFPGVVESLRDLFDEFRNAVRNALTAIKDAIEEAINNVKEGIDQIIDNISGLFDRRRRQVVSDEILLLDEVLQYIVNDFCADLSSNNDDQCWNGTAIGAYNPDTSAGFTVESQVNNTAVEYAVENPSVAVDNAEAGVSALSSNAPSSNAVCESLTQSGGNASVYNELSTSDEACFSELNGATLLASSVFMVLSLSILVLHTLYMF